MMFLLRIADSRMYGNNEVLFVDEGVPQCGDRFPNVGAAPPKGCECYPSIVHEGRKEEFRT